MNRRRLLATLGAMLLVSTVATGASADQPMIHASHGTAIRGYDPVAYFTDGKPVKGSSAHHVMWKGAVWFFASARHQEMFESNPRAFAPKYGGYCAYALSRGHLSVADPLAWKVFDGRLYLTRDVKMRDLWQQDLPGNVIRANANWPGVLSK